MPFDPTHAVAFDLPQGAVTDRSDTRLLLLPAEALGEMLESIPAPAARKLGASVGAAVGRRTALALGGKEGVQGAPLSSVLEQVAGEFAVIGLGVATFERWGRALALVLDGAAVTHEGFLGGVVSAAVEASNGASVFPVVVREGTRIRVLLLSERGALRARALVSDGKNFAEIVLRLTEGAS
jgi:hypothetical protein